MGVQTRADELLEEARGKLGDAARALSELILDETWGWDDYGKEYRAEVHDVLSELITLKKRLG
jgi:hypothetical protein